MEYKNKKRSGALFTLLSLITLNIYCLVVINQVRKEVDYFTNKKSKPFWPIWILGFITLGIAPLIYISLLSNRIEEKATQLEISKPRTSFASTFNFAFFGILFIVGPFIGFHKMFATLNEVETILTATPVTMNDLETGENIIKDVKQEEVKIEDNVNEQPKIEDKTPSIVPAGPRVVYESKALDNNSSCKWRVRYASREDAVKVFDTQEEAIEFAKSLVKYPNAKITVKSK